MARQSKTVFWNYFDQKKHFGCIGNPFVWTYPAAGALQGLSLELLDWRPNDHTAFIRAICLFQAAEHCPIRATLESENIMKSQLVEGKPDGGAAIVDPGQL
jgi:hypothetical protein